MTICHLFLFGTYFEVVVKKIIKTMRKKYYLFDLSDLFFNQLNFDFGDLDNSKFPKDNDSNFNKEIEEIETETHIIKKETWISTDGTSKYVKTYSESKRPKIDVKLLESKLKEAIKKEEFERAAELRDQIKEFKKEKGEN
jgi:protein arginine kinase activator